jgi:hypothetical protein
MTTTAQPFTLHSVLYGADVGSSELSHALQDTGALGAVAETLPGLSIGLRNAVIGEVASVVSRVLELELGFLLLTGWQKHEALTDAAQRTISNPGAEEIVDLATHRIVSTHRPRIDLVVDGAKVSEVELQIEVTFVLHAVCGVISAGRLIALRSGRADVTAELQCEGVHVTSSTRQVELPIVLELGSGVMLAVPLQR